jgi:hypothetical protein
VRRAALALLFAVFAAGCEDRSECCQEPLDPVGLRVRRVGENAFVLWGATPPPVDTLRLRVEANSPSGVVTLVDTMAVPVAENGAFRADVRVVPGSGAVEPWFLYLWNDEVQREWYVGLTSDMGDVEIGEFLAEAAAHPDSPTYNIWTRDPGDTIPDPYGDSLPRPPGDTVAGGPRR